MRKSFTLWDSVTRSKDDDSGNKGKSVEELLSETIDQRRGSISGKGKNITPGKLNTEIQKLLSNKDKSESDIGELKEVQYFNIQANEVIVTYTNKTVKCLPPKDFVTEYKKILSDLDDEFFLADFGDSEFSTVLESYSQGELTGQKKTSNADRKPPATGDSKPATTGKNTVDDLPTTLNIREKTKSQLGVSPFEAIRSFRKREDTDEPETPLPPADDLPPPLPVDNSLGDSNDTSVPSGPLPPPITGNQIPTTPQAVPQLPASLPAPVLTSLQNGGNLANTSVGDLLLTSSTANNITTSLNDLPLPPTPEKRTFSEEEKNILGENSQLTGTVKKRNAVPLIIGRISEPRDVDDLNPSTATSVREALVKVNKRPIDDFIGEKEKIKAMLFPDYKPAPAHSTPIKSTKPKPTTNQSFGGTQRGGLPQPKNSPSNVKVKVTEIPVGPQNQDPHATPQLSTTHSGYVKMPSVLKKPENPAPALTRKPSVFRDSFFKPATTDSSLPPVVNPDQTAQGVSKLSAAKPTTTPATNQSTTPPVNPDQTTHGARKLGAKPTTTPATNQSTTPPVNNQDQTAHGARKLGAKPTTTTATNQPTTKAQPTTGHAGGAKLQQAFQKAFQKRLQKDEQEKNRQNKPSFGSFDADSLFENLFNNMTIQGGAQQPDESLFDTIEKKVTDPEAQKTLKKVAAQSFDDLLRQEREAETPSPTKQSKDFSSLRKKPTTTVTSGTADQSRNRGFTSFKNFVFGKSDTSRAKGQIEYIINSYPALSSDNETKLRSFLTAVAKAQPDAFGRFADAVTEFYGKSVTHPQRSPIGTSLQTLATTYSRTHDLTGVNIENLTPEKIQLDNMLATETETLWQVAETLDVGNSSSLQTFKNNAIQSLQKGAYPRGCNKNGDTFLHIVAKKLQNAPLIDKLRVMDTVAEIYKGAFSNTPQPDDRVTLHGLLDTPDNTPEKKTLLDLALETNDSTLGCWLVGNGAAFTEKHRAKLEGRHVPTHQGEKMKFTLGDSLQLAEDLSSANPHNTNIQSAIKNIEGTTQKQLESFSAKLPPAPIRQQQPMDTKNLHGVMPLLVKPQSSTDSTITLSGNTITSEAQERNATLKKQTLTRNQQPQPKTGTATNTSKRPIPSVFYQSPPVQVQTPPQPVTQNSESAVVPPPQPQLAYVNSSVLIDSGALNNIFNRKLQEQATKLGNTAITQPWRLNLLRQEAIKETQKELDQDSVYQEKRQDLADFVFDNLQKGNPIAIEVDSKCLCPEIFRNAVQDVKFISEQLVEIKKAERGDLSPAGKKILANLDNAPLVVADKKPQPPMPQTKINVNRSNLVQAVTALPATKAKLVYPTTDLTAVSNPKDRLDALFGTAIKALGDQKVTDLTIGAASFSSDLSTIVEARPPVQHGGYAKLEDMNVTPAPVSGIPTTEGQAGWMADEQINTYITQSYRRGDNKKGDITNVNLYNSQANPIDAKKVENPFDKSAIYIEPTSLVALQNENTNPFHSDMNLSLAISSAESENQPFPHNQDVLNNACRIAAVNMDENHWLTVLLKPVDFNKHLYDLVVIDPNSTEKTGKTLGNYANQIKNAFESSGFTISNAYDLSIDQQKNEPTHDKWSCGEWTCKNIQYVLQNLPLEQTNMDLWVNEKRNGIRGLKLPEQKALGGSYDKGAVVTAFNEKLVEFEQFKLVSPAPVTQKKPVQQPNRTAPKPPNKPQAAAATQTPLYCLNAAEFIIGEEGDETFTPEGAEIVIKAIKNGYHIAITAGDDPVGVGRALMSLQTTHKEERENIKKTIVLHTKQGYNGRLNDVYIDLDVASQTGQFLPQINQKLGASGQKFSSEILVEKSHHDNDETEGLIALSTRTFNTMIQQPPAQKKPALRQVPPAPKVQPVTNDATGANPTPSSVPPVSHTGEFSRLELIKQKLNDAQTKLSAHPSTNVPPQTQEGGIVIPPITGRLPIQAQPSGYFGTPKIADTTSQTNTEPDVGGESSILEKSSSSQNPFSFFSKGWGFLKSAVTSITSSSETQSKKTQKTEESSSKSPSPLSRGHETEEKKKLVSPDFVIPDQFFIDLNQVLKDKIQEHRSRSFLKLAGELSTLKTEIETAKTNGDRPTLIGKILVVGAEHGLPQYNSPKALLETIEAAQLNAEVNTLETTVVALEKIRDTLSEKYVDNPKVHVVKDADELKTLIEKQNLEKGSIIVYPQDIQGKIVGVKVTITQPAERDPFTTDITQRMKGNIQIINPREPKTTAREQISQPIVDSLEKDIPDLTEGYRIFSSQSTAFHMKESVMKEATDELLIYITLDSEIQRSVSPKKEYPKFTSAEQFNTSISNIAEPVEGVINFYDPEPVALAPQEELDQLSQAWKTRPVVKPLAPLVSQDNSQSRNWDPELRRYLGVGNTYSTTFRNKKENAQSKNALNAINEMKQQHEAYHFIASSPTSSETQISTAAASYVDAINKAQVAVGIKENVDKVLVASGELSKLDRIGQLQTAAASNVEKQKQAQKKPMPEVPFIFPDYMDPESELYKQTVTAYNNVYAGKEAFANLLLAQTTLKSVLELNTARQAYYQGLLEVSKNPVDKDSKINTLSTNYINALTRAGNALMIPQPPSRDTRLNTLNQFGQDHVGKLENIGKNKKEPSPPQSPKTRKIFGIPISNPFSSSRGFSQLKGEEEKEEKKKPSKAEIKQQEEEQKMKDLKNKASDALKKEFSNPPSPAVDVDPKTLLPNLQKAREIAQNAVGKGGVVVVRSVYGAQQANDSISELNNKQIEYTDLNNGYKIAVLPATVPVVKNGKTTQQPVAPHALERNLDNTTEMLEGVASEKEQELKTLESKTGRIPLENQKLQSLKDDAAQLSKDYVTYEAATSLLKKQQPESGKYEYTNASLTQEKQLVDALRPLGDTLVKQHKDSNTDPFAVFNARGSFEPPVDKFMKDHEASFGGSVTTNPKGVVTIDENKLKAAVKKTQPPVPSTTMPSSTLPPPILPTRPAPPTPIALTQEEKTAKIKGFFQNDIAHALAESFNHDNNANQDVYVITDVSALTGDNRLMHHLIDVRDNGISGGTKKPRFIAFPYTTDNAHVVGMVMDTQTKEIRVYDHQDYSRTGYVSKASTLATTLGYTAVDAFSQSSYSSQTGAECTILAELSIEEDIARHRNNLPPVLQKNNVTDIDQQVRRINQQAKDNKTREALGTNPPAVTTPSTSSTLPPPILTTPPKPTMTTTSTPKPTTTSTIPTTSAMKPATKPTTTTTTPPVSNIEQKRVITPEDRAEIFQHAQNTTSTIESILKKRVKPAGGNIATETESLKGSLQAKLNIAAHLKNPKAPLDLSMLSQEDARDLSSVIETYRRIGVSASMGPTTGPTGSQPHTPYRGH